MLILAISARQPIVTIEKEWMMTTISNRTIAEAGKNLDALAANPYPGRGIVAGLDESGKNVVQVYWIMGRSDNSRNRIFEVNEFGELYTKAADPTLVKDPSLIIYRAMSYKERFHVVSNGKQTDTVIETAKSTNDALYSVAKHHNYEPDEPNFTPRITAVCDLRVIYPLIEFSVLRRSPFSEACDRSHHAYAVHSFGAGYGRCITTYYGDGNPLPAFEGVPYWVPIRGSDPASVAEMFWDHLDQDNRISVAVKFIPLDHSRPTIKVINKYSAV